jgi:antitoxin (DNA-binding transcriptional repressor) of toxin-antitoxin stability system
MSDHIASRKRKPRQPSVQQPVGVRELKTHAARILREVRDSGASFVLTHRGKAIGVILPLERTNGVVPDVDDEERAWANFWEAGRRLEKGFRRGKSAMRELFKMRSQR